MTAESKIGILSPRQGEEFVLGVFSGKEIGKEGMGCLTTCWARINNQCPFRSVKVSPACGDCVVADESALRFEKDLNEREKNKSGELRYNWKTTKHVEDEGRAVNYRFVGENEQFRRIKRGGLLRVQGIGDMNPTERKYYKEIFHGRPSDEYPGLIIYNAIPDISNYFGNTLNFELISRAQRPERRQMGQIDRIKKFLK